VRSHLERLVRAVLRRVKGSWSAWAKFHRVLYICGHAIPLHQLSIVRAWPFDCTARRAPSRSSTSWLHRDCACSACGLAFSTSRWSNLHSGSTGIVSKTCQPQKQEFPAIIANHINLGILPAKPEILGIRDFHFMRANLTDAIQTEL